MPDYRVFKRNLVENERFGTLPLFAQHLFMMLCLLADDQGRLIGHPAFIRSRAFPYQDVSLSDVSDGLAALSAAGLILRYQAEGRELIQILTWWDDQSRMQWASPSEYPAPDGWEDRVRYRKGNQIVARNWSTRRASPPSPVSPPPSTPPSSSNNGAAGEPPAPGMPPEATGGMCSAAPVIEETSPPNAAHPGGALPSASPAPTPLTPPPEGPQALPEALPEGLPKALPKALGKALPKRLPKALPEALPKASGKALGEALIKIKTQTQTRTQSQTRIATESSLVDDDGIKNHHHLLLDSGRDIKSEAAALIRQLQAAGVFPNTAVRLVRMFPDERIRAFLELYPLALQVGRARNAGWLVSAIQTPEWSPVDERTELERLTAQQQSCCPNGVPKDIREFLEGIGWVSGWDEVARWCEEDVERVQQWVYYARKHRMGGGLLRQALRRGGYPPDCVPENEQARRKYLSGPYADYIEH